MHYWDKGSLAGGDTPIGAVKHSFIVQQLYCQTTTRDPDLSFGSLVFENFILDIRRGVKNEYFTVRLTLIVRGLKNAFFMPFTPPLHRYPTMTLTVAMKSKDELEIQEVGYKWLFSCVKSVSEHIKS